MFDCWKFKLNLEFFAEVLWQSLYLFHYRDQWLHDVEDSFISSDDGLHTVRWTSKLRSLCCRLLFCRPEGVMSISSVMVCLACSYNIKIMLISHILSLLTKLFALGSFGRCFILNWKYRQFYLRRFELLLWKNFPCLESVLLQHEDSWKAGRLNLLRIWFEPWWLVVMNYHFCHTVKYGSVAV